MEDYKEKYEMALEGVQEILSSGQDSIKMSQLALRLHGIFPELKESEDEKMVKAIIKALQSHSNSYNKLSSNGIQMEDAIAWLNKQVPTKISEEDEKIRKEILSLIQYTKGRRIGYEPRIHQDEMLAWLEKQDNSSIKWQKNTPENKPPKNHSVLMKTVDGISEGEWDGKYWHQYRWSTHIYDSNVLYWIELHDLDAQGVQKPTSDIRYEVKAGDSLSVVNGKPFDYEHATIIQKDFAPKQEPKFKIGDWVVDKNGIVRQILSYKDGIYKHTDGYSAEIFEDEWRMWTIKDAKDGDVLFDNLNNILIYQEPSTRTFLHSYCYCHQPSVSLIAAEGSHEIKGVHPATKEQHDLLFQKMKEAGYEWDADKKELKLLITNGGDFEQKQEWSEEDESYINNAIAACRSLYGEYSETAHWLKSLKDRMKG